MLKSLKPGDVFYDVGANNGFITLLGSRIVGVHGAIYAFEPLPQNSRMLTQVIARNALTNCELIPEAVSDSLGRADLYVQADGATTTPSLINRTGQRTAIQTTTLDYFRKEHRHPNLIKIDVEGAEHLVLLGASTLLGSSNPPKWIIEVHSESCHTNVAKLLGAYGYQIEKLKSTRNARAAYPFHISASKQ